jgi:hypothetical protein
MTDFALPEGLPAPLPDAASARNPVRWFIPSPSSPIAPAWMAVRRDMAAASGEWTGGGAVCTRCIME